MTGQMLCKQVYRYLLNWIFRGAAHLRARMHPRERIAFSLRAPPLPEEAWDRSGSVLRREKLISRHETILFLDGNAVTPRKQRSRRREKWKPRSRLSFALSRSCSTLNITLSTIFSDSQSERAVKRMEHEKADDVAVSRLLDYHIAETKHFAIALYYKSIRQRLQYSNSRRGRARQSRMSA